MIKNVTDDKYLEVSFQFVGRDQGGHSHLHPKQSFPENSHSQQRMQCCCFAIVAKYRCKKLLVLLLT